MMVSKQLGIILQFVLITSVINNSVSVNIPNLPQLWELCRDYFVPHFQKGGLVLPNHEQFAVAILQPGNAWLGFRYSPSANNNGLYPVIEPNFGHPRSPPDRIAARYNNYLAARPHNGVHSEIQILDRLDELYNAYVRNHNGQAPRALLIYSWIVPCIGCTDRIVNTFTRAPFNAIPVKVVAHTTDGTNCADCDVNYTRRELDRAGIGFTKVYVNENDLLANLINELFVG